MEYENTLKGIFIERTNRFTAHVEVEGKVETVHVKNTGKLGELLIPGTEVILQRVNNENRKTQYDLISVRSEKIGWVNIDSQVTNKLIYEWLIREGYERVKPEYVFGRSRIDFYMEKKGEKYLLEIKGCTLEHDGYGLFPDAVSERAAKHERELMDALKMGYHAVTGFVIAMNGITEVRPNSVKDPVFAAAYSDAASAGVETWYFPCIVNENRIEIDKCIIKQKQED